MAKQLVQKDIELQKHKYALGNCRQSFARERSVFLHQLVYNIETKKIQPLHEWEEIEGMKRIQACGQYPFIEIFFYNKFTNTRHFQYQYHEQL